ADGTARFAFPPLQHHNWKYIAFGPDKKLYVPFGAPCNICEPPQEYAQIRRYNADGSGMEVIARGIRNSLGFDWHPQTHELWFTDNGRDWMGEEGPEDELNRVSKPGLDFGFPYCHANGMPDAQVKRKDPCKGVTLPVALLGPHATALGMLFYTGGLFPPASCESRTSRTARSIACGIGNSSRGGSMEQRPAKRLVVYVGENQRWHHKPLWREVVDVCRKHGLAGTTATKGIVGFGHSGKV